jgi:sec-independent protein translocase protein TatA
MSLGLPELVIILVIVVLIFGAGRLAGLGKGLGQAIRGFKEELPSGDDGQEEKDEERRRRDDG